MLGPPGMLVCSIKADAETVRRFRGKVNQQLATGHCVILEDGVKFVPMTLVTAQVAVAAAQPNSQASPSEVNVQRPERAVFQRVAEAYV